MATLLGLALLLAKAPSVRLITYVLGGAYLVWVGARLLFIRGLKDAGATGAAPAADVVTSAAGTFAQGILTALANVQALFFLASIFAGVGILKANLATGLVAVGVIVVGNGCYLMLLAWLMQKPAARSFYNRYRPSMEVGFGAVFVLLGARLLARELAGWP